MLAKGDKVFYRSFGSGTFPADVVAEPDAYGRTLVRVWTNVDADGKVYGLKSVELRVETARLSPREATESAI